VDRRAQEQAGRPRGGSIWPSSVGLCLRKAIYQYRGCEPTNPPPPRLLRIFEVGKLFEKFILEMLEERGVLVAAQLEVKSLFFSGRIDALVRQGTQLYVVELKTIHSKGFIYRDLPYAHHEVQALVYHILAELNGWAPLAPPHLVYISKDDLLIDEYVVSLQKKVEVERLMREAAAYARDGRLPPRLEGGPRRWECWHEAGQRPACEYFDLCWGGKERGYEA